jgi:hypothetical protein
MPTQTKDEEKEPIWPLQKGHCDRKQQAPFAEYAALFEPRCAGCTRETTTAIKHHWIVVWGPREAGKQHDRLMATP